jgi:hypothetical protein
MKRKVEFIESYIKVGNDYQWNDNHGELIRCRDCVYFTPEKSGEHWNICRFYDAPKTADGYCNDAEPKVKE